MVRRIAVCDDQQEIRRQMAHYLQRIAAERGETFDVLYFSSGEELLEGLPQDIQVILLDIRMGALSGIDAARQLQGCGYTFSLFLITNCLEYALEGYDVHAYCFLPKPVPYPALKQNLAEVFQRIDTAQGTRVALRVGAEVEVIDCQSLLYVEVLRHECTFVYAERRSVHPVSLSVLEEKLRPYGFFRCHKGYLVNLRHITHISASDVSLGAYQVPVSKYRRQALLAAYARIWGETL